MAKQGNNRDKVGPGHPPAEHQFAPGQSGNPNGRPKSRPIAAALSDLADKNDGEALKALAAVCWDRALRGDFRFAKELMERIDGKVLTEMDLTSGGETITGGDERMQARVAAAVEAMNDGGDGPT
jgi:hypothetical protein